MELFNITYEVQPERFKSLRLSNGTYPDNAFLDYEDKEVVIKEDFLVEFDDINTDEPLLPKGRSFFQ